jgi:predicted phosphoribosyltransferase
MGILARHTEPELPFADRRAAGQFLARELKHVAGEDTIILGLPRGGVPVAYEVAMALGGPLDVFVVRKLGAPGQEELAMGAIASGGILVRNERVLAGIPDSERAISIAVERELPELRRRELDYRAGRPPLGLLGKTVILVDDGLATGSTMRAAVAAVRQHQIARCLVAAPVGANDTCRDLQEIADEVICASTPEPFRGVGQFYRDFTQTTDVEVRELLARSR